MLVGCLVPGVTKKITREKINKYAQASGDFNPLHIDEEFARKTVFKGTIAHGLLSAAYISEMMSNWLGESWLEGGELEVSFLHPVRSGDTITAGGKVIDISQNGSAEKIICEVYCQNQEGDLVIKGLCSCKINKYSKGV
ncbi:MaoC family dehydratase [Desulfoscipio geothermicus]|uniref:3-hydroxybutyryl-CoA dehydratase n=1 Tax=Desulfoscipio geothermicus DSM 3669 TaxID=1121426 RepID=A0A1I6DGP0_9FIRM|nr:MaoC family dehydratase [Desulfoscipio geothermicus]SFR04604.1 3-hydroxybutyryl-CoA dehydratase [Desulfoscipio geothermicus DSM 3669]